MERNNTILDFESSLKRHIKMSGGMAGPCRGLDIDSAGAYLEGALSDSSLRNYESHLAGCAACRHDVIELSRLEQIAGKLSAHATHIENNPQWAAKLGSVISEKWRSLMSTGWVWQSAGIATAACLMIASVIVYRPWMNDTHRTNSPALASRPDAAGLTNQDAVQSESLIEMAENDEGTATSNRRGRVIPSPQIDLFYDGMSTLNNRALSRDLANLPSVQNTQILETPVSVLPGPAEYSNSASAGSAIADSVGKEEGETAEIAARINPNVDYNPMRTVSTGPRKAAAKSRNEKPALQAGRPEWQNRVMGFMPVIKPERSGKSEEAAVDADAPVQMTRKVRDKTFRYERGVWVDQAFKPDMMSWRVTRLIAGSRDYEQVLAAEPLLKEFFSLGQIVIVWQNKIYKVAGR